MDKRPNGMFTSGNRRFLEESQSSRSRQSRQDHRDRIKERVLASVQDFRLLTDEYETQDIQETFEWTTLSDELLEECIVSMLQFCYALSTKVNLPFEELVFKGINRAMSDGNKRSNPEIIEVEIDRRAVHLEQIISKLKSRKEPTEAEYEILYKLLKNRPESFLTVIEDTDENRFSEKIKKGEPFNDNEKQVIIRQLKGKTRRELWQVVLEIANLPYDEADIDRLIS